MIKHVLLMLIVLSTIVVGAAGVLKQDHYVPYGSDLEITFKEGSFVGVRIHEDSSINFLLRGVSGVIFIDKIETMKITIKYSINGSDFQKEVIPMGSDLKLDVHEIAGDDLKISPKIVRDSPKVENRNVVIFFDILGASTPEGKDLTQNVIPHAEIVDSKNKDPMLIYLLVAAGILFLVYLGLSFKRKPNKESEDEESSINEEAVYVAQEIRKPDVEEEVPDLKVLKKPIKKKVKKKAKKKAKK